MLSLVSKYYWGRSKLRVSGVGKIMIFGKSILDINAYIPLPLPPLNSYPTLKGSWHYSRKLIYIFLPMLLLAWNHIPIPYISTYYSWAVKISHVTSLKNLLNVIFKFKTFYGKSLSSKNLNIQAECVGG